MGRKLTANEIDVISDNDMYQGFDICCKCSGVELEGSMRSMSEDLDDDRLICDECATVEEEEWKKST